MACGLNHLCPRLSITHGRTLKIAPSFFIVSWKDGQASDFTRTEGLSKLAVSAGGGTKILQTAPAGPPSHLSLCFGFIDRNYLRRWGGGRTEARQHGGMLHPIREPRFVELVVLLYVE